LADVDWAAMIQKAVDSVAHLGSHVDAGLAIGVDAQVVRRWRDGGRAKPKGKVKKALESYVAGLDSLPATPEARAAAVLRDVLNDVNRRLTEAIGKLQPTTDKGAKGRNAIQFRKTAAKGRTRPEPRPADLGRKVEGGQ
jgi:hypothetical protein